MFNKIRRIFGCLLIAAYLAAGIPLAQGTAQVLPVLLKDNPQTRAEVLLSDLPVAAYEDEIEKALADGDGELAESLLLLAETHGAAISHDLAGRVAEANRFSAVRTAKDVLRGAILGEAETREGLGAVVVTELTAIGDVRDLVREAAAWPDYDGITVAFAAAGLAISAATVGTGGMALPVTGPAKLGVGLVKVARRTGRISARLLGDLSRLARRVIDPGAVARLSKNAAKLDSAGTRAAARGIVREGALEPIKRIGLSVGSIASTSGTSAALHSLSVAENVSDLNHLRRLSKGFGKGYRGVLALAPRIAKGVAKTTRLALKLTWRIGSMLLWLTGWVWALIRLLHFSVGLIARAIVRIV